RLAAIKSGLLTGSDTPGFPMTEKRLKDDLERLEHQPPAKMQKILLGLFDDLPRRVQEQDLHLGNFPGIGKVPMIGHYLEKDAQVRHYMRSTEATPSREAERKSKGYIGTHLYSAWERMHAAVSVEKHWNNRFNDWRAFDQGTQHLAQALHTIEDSYA